MNRPPKTVYLAARWSMREQVEVYAQQLKAIGIDVTSRWLTDPEHRATEQGDAQAFNAKLAGHDVYDVEQADALIYFGPGGTRGGSHVEFGMALAFKKRLFWVGDREHVFSWMPRVEVHQNWPELLSYLRGQVEGFESRYATMDRLPS